MGTEWAKNNKLAKTLKRLNCKDYYHVGWWISATGLSVVLPSGIRLSVSPPDKQGGQRTLLCLEGHILDLAGSRDAVLWVSSLESWTKSGVRLVESWVQIRSPVPSGPGLKPNKSPWGQMENRFQTPPVSRTGAISESKNEPPGQRLLVSVPMGKAMLGDDKGAQSKQWLGWLATACATASICSFIHSANIYWLSTLSQLLFQAISVHPWTQTNKPLSDFCPQRANILVMEGRYKQIH